VAVEGSVAVKGRAPKCSGRGHSVIVLSKMKLESEQWLWPQGAGQATTMESGESHWFGRHLYIA